MTDLVSIIIPVYNGSNYLSVAIDSALKQTYQNIEVIVVNDGSDDNGATRRIAESYGKSLIYIEKENGGVASALNVGISRMRGAWFSWLSHDDVYDEHKIEVQIHQAEMLPESIRERCCIYCGNDYIDQFGNRLLHPVQRAKSLDNRVLEADEVTRAMAKGLRFGGCNFLIPSALLKGNRFNEDLLYTQDAELWTRLFAAGSYLFMNTAEVLVSTRVHKDQGQSKLRHRVKMEESAIGSVMVPAILKLEDSKDALTAYQLRCLKHGHVESARIASEALIAHGWITPRYLCRAFLASLYGKLRPIARSLYHAIFHGFIR